jgi:hypothetical protein
MNNNRLIAAATKAGATVTITSRMPCGAPHCYVAQKGEKRVVWYVQDGFRNGNFTKDEMDAVCVHTPSPHTDAMTDCYCDYHHKTIKSAVAALN